MGDADKDAFTTQSDQVSVASEGSEPKKVGPASGIDIQHCGLSTSLRTNFIEDPWTQSIWSAGDYCKLEPVAPRLRNPFLPPVYHAQTTYEDHAFCHKDELHDLARLRQKAPSPPPSEHTVHTDSTCATDQGSQVERADMASHGQATSVPPSVRSGHTEQTLQAEPTDVASHVQPSTPSVLAGKGG